VADKLLADLEARAAG